MKSNSLSRPLPSEKTSIETSKFDKPSAGLSITLTVTLKNQPGVLAKLVQAVADSGGTLGEMHLLNNNFESKQRKITVLCRSSNHISEVLKDIESIPEITIDSWQDDTFAIHEGGKLSVETKVAVTGRDDLARVYTPGVGRVCTAIHKNPDLAFQYTLRANTVAVVSDGSAVLGLGNIGPLGAMPVMEGKALLFKKFGGLNSFPICINTQDTEEIIALVKNIAPTFGAINLEDISAPRCFYIEERLRNELDIPVMHDDQHGTAVVVLAGLINALKITGKKMEDIKVVVNGFGAGGVACSKILLNAGVRNLIACDTAGALYRGRVENMNPVKQSLMDVTNPNNEKGKLADVIRGADLFLGVSSPGVLTAADVRTMNKRPIVFALANPIPEILPEAIKGIASVIATGRSDYPNQVNNALCFPGIFKGALACRARSISESMKLAAARSIADSVTAAKLSENYIIPSIFEEGIAENVAVAVEAQARKEKLNRV